MRKSWVRLYGPFLALVVCQALLVTVAPSVARRGDETSLSATGGSGGSSEVGGETIDPTTGQVVADPSAPGSDPTSAGGGGSGPGSSSAGGGGGSNSSGGGPTGPGKTTTGGPGAGPTGPNLPAAAGKYAAGAIGNDIAHCSKPGSKAGPDRQFDAYYYAPPCQPKWPAGADNGGPTYQGVTKDKIKVVRYVPRPNAAVDGILQTFGLYTDPRQGEDYQENVVEPFINKRYELWGRKVDFVTVTGNCEYSPPDIPCLVKEAQDLVTKEKPFAVLAISGFPSATYDVFARNKVISLGGWHYEESFFTKRAPYRYDILMDGSRSVRNMADYYCKKLVGKPPTHSGQVIHSSFGATARRGTGTRKIGILVPEDPATAPNGELLKKLLEGGMCGKAGDVPVFIKYASDISKAQTQASTAIQNMIQGKVTTIICVCDPIAPLYFTNTATQQQYFPEHLIEGISLIDYDLVGRIYNGDQWQHAFGPSHLFANRPLSESYEQVEWAAEGKQGTVPPNMGLIGGYERVFGWFLQQAGPNLNPESVKVAMLDKRFIRGGWVETGKEKASFRAEFGPGDWTAWDDAREVYWSNTERSVLDGRPGAYVNVNGGQRHNVMQWPQTDGVPYIPPAAA